MKAQSGRGRRAKSRRTGRAQGPLPRLRPIASTGPRGVPRCIDKRRLLKRAFGYLAKYPKRRTHFGLTISITLLQLVPTYLTKIMVDDVLIPGNLNAFWRVIAAIVVTHGLFRLLSAFHIYSIHWLGNRLVVDLRTEVYAKLQQLTMTFYDKRQTGWIMSRVTNDTSFLQHFMVHGLQQIIVHVLMIAGIIVVLFSMNWKLAFMTLLPLPFVVLGTSWFSKRMHKVYHRIWRRVSNMHAILATRSPASGSSRLLPGKRTK